MKRSELIAAAKEIKIDLPFLTEYLALTDQFIFIQEWLDCHLPMPTLTDAPNTVELVVEVIEKRIDAACIALNIPNE
jgi:hypothetical protein